MPSVARQRFFESRKLQRKRIASQQIAKLLNMAVEENRKHPEFAQRHSAIAWKLSTKFNVRLENWRIFFCRQCKKFVVPPNGVRYRFSKKNRRTLNITCLECGRTYHKILPVRENR